MIDMGWQGWAIFNGAVILMLLLDLGVFNRKAQKVTVKAALYWTAFWIILSMAFNGWMEYMDARSTLRRSAR